MPTLMCPCTTCKKQTPHQSAGVRQKESDGRVSQMMQCVVCKTLTTVYFTKGTNEFQVNLDLPDKQDG